MIPVMPALARSQWRPEPFAVDTGAQQSFLGPSLAAGLAVIGQNPDEFSPGYGRFAADLVEATVKVGSAALAIQPALLPEGLHWLLASAGITGIIGLDILAAQVFDFDTQNSRLSPAISITTR